MLANAAALAQTSGHGRPWPACSWFLHHSFVHVRRVTASSTSKQAHACSSLLALSTSNVNAPSSLTPGACAFLDFFMRSDLIRTSMRKPSLQLVNHHQSLLLAGACRSSILLHWARVLLVGDSSQMASTAACLPHRSQAQHL